MIERYALYDIDKLCDQFNLTKGVPKGVKKHYNIVPSQQVPVIMHRDGSTVMELMQWGFVPQNAKDTNSIFRYKTHTVKSEEAFKKTMWEKVIRSQRCLIPANGFYTWKQTNDGKVPYFVRAKGQPIAAYAGVYSSWTDSNEVTSGMTSIVTVAADSMMSKYTDSAPVIVPSQQIKTWLDPTISYMVSLYDVMRPLARDSLEFAQVSDKIYSKKIDTPALIEKV